MDSNVLERRLSKIAIITSDRPDALARGLESYASSTKRGSQSNLSITVFDDSRLPHITAENERIVIEASQRRELPVHFVGVKERTQFVNELVAFNLPSDVVHYALLPAPSSICRFSTSQSGGLMIGCTSVYCS